MVKNVNETKEGIALGLFMIAAMVPLFMISYQVVLYLKSGAWVPFSAINLLSYLGFDWAKSPNDWLGVWKMLNSVHASCIISPFLIFIGAALSK